MPRLIRLYIDSILIGFLLGIGFTAALLLLDLGGLGHLVMHTDGGVLGAVLIAVLNGMTFAALQFAYVVMRKPQDD